MPEFFKPGALNYFTLFHPIPLTLSASRNPILIHLPFQIPGFSAVHSNHTHYWSGILSPDVIHASGSVIIFFRQSLYLSLNFQPPLFSLNPYSNDVGVNIFLNNSSSVSFLNVYAPLFSLPQWMAEPTPFLFSRNLFNCHHPLWDSKGTSNLCGMEVFDWVISSDLLPLNDPHTHTPFAIASLVVIPPLTFPLLPPLLPFLAPGRFFRTWVLTIYQFFYLFLFLQSFAPMSIPLQFSESLLG